MYAVASTLSHESGIQIRDPSEAELGARAGLLLHGRKLRNIKIKNGASE